MLRRQLWLSLLSALLLLGLGVPSQVAQAAPANGLPNHFGIGLIGSNDPSGLGGWLPDSKIPWDYTYQYLSAGVNTGHGWATWNDKAQFPVYYAKAAASHGYMPVFTYYNLLYSNGPCTGCGEKDKDLANLNDPSTMKDYFNDFALLMKRLSNGSYDGIQGFGQTAIVHVEPDLSAYAQQAAMLDDPTTVPAAVASSGVPEVAAFPNTYQGFNWALLHLRDQYAPNVLLAFHASPWATGSDIGTSNDPALDAAGIGARTGEFAARSGVVQAGPDTSTYDLLFSDVLDRDAGFYAYAQNDHKRWWDRLNIAYPDFQRWEQWVASAVQAAGNKPMIVWQIPLGNQYFQTENNTKGHYQDNRAEYFFSHLDELRQVGIIGLLFGGGGGDVTSYNDAAKDGVTNPPSFCTTDGVSSGQVCNDHQSTVADDDGGFLRMSAQQYYANPLPIGAITAHAPTSGAASASPNVNAPSAAATTAPASNVPLEVDLGSSAVDPVVASPGQDVTLRQNSIANADGTVLVDFELFDATNRQAFQTSVANQPIQVGSVLSTSTVFTVPDGLSPGRYTLKVGVFSDDGSTLYTWSDAAGTLTIAP
jgi:hypothetical protein